MRRLNANRIVRLQNRIRVQFAQKIQKLLNRVNYLSVTFYVYNSRAKPGGLSPQIFNLFLKNFSNLLAPISLLLNTRIF